MGVVRREGDWRLEKRGEGVYEITFQREAQVKVLTSDASPGMSQSGFSMIPERRVQSYAEVEGLFEEKAHGPPPMGMTSSTNEGGGFGSVPSTPEGEGDVDLSDLPPLGIGFALMATGGIIIYALRDVGNAPYVLIGLAFIIAGISPFAYAGYLLRTEDWATAWEFLVTVDETNDSRGSSDQETQKTPPASEKLKNALFFDRADQQCEWCEDAYDHLEVHHIIPRSEGGPNEPENLIVLCPNCHEKADRDAIPRSKLKAKVKRLPDIALD